jgi:hypothetical protein
MIWILDSGREILVGPEAFRQIKHPSLACGQQVWGAGEIGFVEGKVRVVNLKTGHYLGRAAVGYKDVLMPFLNQVFTEYNHNFLMGKGLFHFDIRAY